MTTKKLDILKPQEQMSARISLGNNQANCIHEEIKNRLNSGNDCCNLVHNLLSPSLLSQNIKINIYGTVILLFVLYECGTSSLRLREGCRSRVFDNRVLRKIFGPK